MRTDADLRRQRMAEELRLIRLHGLVGHLHIAAQAGNQRVRGALRSRIERLREEAGLLPESFGRDDTGLFQQRPPWGVDLTGAQPAVIGRRATVREIAQAVGSHGGYAQEIIDSGALDEEAARTILRLHAGGLGIYPDPPTSDQVRIAIAERLGDLGSARDRMARIAADPAAATTADKLRAVADILTVSSVETGRPGTQVEDFVRQLADDLDGLAPRAGLRRRHPEAGGLFHLASIASGLIRAVTRRRRLDGQ